MALAEIMAVAVDVLKVVGKQFDLKFEFQEALIGGAAIDATGEPLPSATLEACRNSDAVLLAAIGGYKWDSLPSNLRPEAGLLGLRLRFRIICQFTPSENFAPANRRLDFETRSCGRRGYYGGARTHWRDLLR